MKPLILLASTQITALSMIKKIIQNGILFSIFFQQLNAVILAQFEAKIN